MRLKNILLTSVLVMAFVVSSVFTVFAEETATDVQGTVSASVEGLLSSLFGENGVFADYIAEGTTTDNLEETADEGSSEGGNVSEALSGIFDTIQSGAEGFNLEALGDLIGQYTGGEDGNAGDLNVDGLDAGDSSDLNLGDLNLDDLNLGDLNLGDLNLGDLNLGDLLGNLNLGDLNLSDLLGSLSGDSDSGEFDFGDLGALIEARQQIMEAEKACVIDMNAERLMPGDIQIVADTILWQDENFDMENDGTQDLNKMVQFNYNLNKEGQLEHVSGIELVILFTLQKDENGNYAVTEAELCDEGENYMPSIEALCEKVGAPVEDCMKELEFSEWDILYELINYMEEHPEVTAIEYNGEMMTADELSALQLELSQAYEEKYPDEEEEYIAEDGGEDTIAEDGGENVIAEDGESSGLNLDDLNLDDLNLSDLLGGLLGDSGSGEAGEDVSN